MERKKVLKIVGGVCAATGVVAMSALVASSAAVGAVVEGFKSAAKVVKKSLDEAENTSEVTEDDFEETEAIVDEVVPTEVIAEEKTEE